MILFADATLVVINKAPGVAVHEAPGAGGSVLRELRERHAIDGVIPVHRLDKDASGVLVLARSAEIASALQRRWPEAQKTYWALCEGAPADERGVIDAPILEHQTGKPERLERALRYFSKMNPGKEIPPLPAPKSSAVHPAGREAQSEYTALARTPKWSWLEVRPKQGRMHQIRVHLRHAGFPLACDALYGNRATLDDLADGSVLLARMPLHAARLRIFVGENVREFEAPLPEDISRAMRVLGLG